MDTRNDNQYLNRSLRRICRRGKKENSEKGSVKGIDVALEKGVKFGRPQVQVPEEWERVIAMVENKEITSVVSYVTSELEENNVL